MKDKELRKLMEERIVKVEFSEAEVLTLHAVAVLKDGRDAMTKLLRKRISPVAMKILEQRKVHNKQVV